MPQAFPESFGRISISSCNTSAIFAIVVTFGTTNDVAAGASLQLRDFRREAPASGSTPGEIAFCKALPILLTGDGDGQSNWYVCENATIWMEGLVQVAATGESISFVKTDIK